jgi:hypothetical protein
MSSNTFGAFVPKFTSWHTPAKAALTGYSFGSNSNSRRFRYWHFTSGQFLPPTLIFVRIACLEGPTPANAATPKAEDPAVFTVRSLVLAVGEQGLEP